MTKEDIKLDNPVWHSLTESHKDFAIQYDGVKFYHPDYCPFGGFVNIDNTFAGINKYGKLSGNFYVVGNKPAFGDNVRLSKELVCNQMLLNTPIGIKLIDEIVEVATNGNDDLFKLVNMVQPGYFKSKTSLLGSYYGIYKDQGLVAVAGERMKMNSYTEVSAIVTHPEHTGKGYAKQLIAFTTNRIFRENKTPYLHVAGTNTSTVTLYEKLGFITRRKISFWNLISSVAT